MSEALRALLVEDSTSDADLVVRALRTGGFAVTHERVDSAAALREALARGPWDVVLCDYALPGFGAPQALEIMREADADVPVIVVSGLIGEGNAIDLMRRGAADYVMKDGLQKLAPVVRREVAEARGRAESRRAKEDLARAQTRYAFAIDSAVDGFATMDTRSRLVEVNTALARLAGRPRESLVGMELAELLSAPSSAACLARHAADACPGPARHEAELRRGDGTMLDVDLSFACHHEGGQEIFLFVHDNAERRRREHELAQAVQQGDRSRLALLSVLEDQRGIEERLRESEERFRGMLDNNVAATYMIEQGRITYCNRRGARILDEEPAAVLGRFAAEFIAPEDHPLLAALQKEMKAGGKSFVEAEFRLVRKDGAVVDVSGSATRATLQGKSVILAAAQDIGERKKAQLEIASYIDRLEHSVQGTLEAVAHMVELRDPYTSGHERRVGDLAAAIGAELGLTEHEVKGLRLTGYVHDIGKISAPAELLVKPTRLSPIEYELIKGHSQAGHDVLSGVDFPWPVAEVILQHHERLDGSGYPRKLKGEEILPEARIIAVADVVEAMASHRPYRPALGIDAALAEIERGAGTAYDAGIAAACVRLFREKGYAFAP